MESTNVLDRFADELFTAAITGCCDDNNLCRFHEGYLDGINSLLLRIDRELVKVGWFRND